MRSLSLAALALPLLLSAPVLAQGSAGQVTCLREVEEVRQMFQRYGGQLPAAEQESYANYLSIADTYCQSEDMSTALQHANIPEIRDRLQQVAEQEQPRGYPDYQ